MVEGRNIAIEYRYAEGRLDRQPELAAELVRLKVDIPVAAGTDRTVRAAKNATKTIPIIMMGSGSDPVDIGLIESLARPGGNITGVANLARELGGKRLELLKEAVPKLARVAVLHEQDNSNNVLELKEVQTAAGALKLTIQPWEVRAAFTKSPYKMIYRKLPKTAALSVTCPHVKLTGSWKILLSGMK